jgi:hypothetical protein
LKSDVMNMIHLTAFFNTVILWWKIRTFSTHRLYSWVIFYSMIRYKILNKHIYRC